MFTRPTFEGIKKLNQNIRIQVSVHYDLKPVVLLVLRVNQLETKTNLNFFHGQFFSYFRSVGGAQE